MKYIKPYDNYIAENYTRIPVQEVIPGTNKASATEEPVEPQTEAQDLAPDEKELEEND